MVLGEQTLVTKTNSQKRMNLSSWFAEEWKYER